MKYMELSFCHGQHKMPHTFHQPGGGKERGLLLRFIVVPQHAVSGLSESECSKTWLLTVHASKFSHLKYAWDGDPNTIWHPTGSGEGAYTTLHLNEVRRKYWFISLFLLIFFSGHTCDWCSGGAVFLEQRVCRPAGDHAQLVRLDRSSGWGSSVRTFTTTFSVFDSKKKTIWEDTEAHETKLVTVFIKEVSLNLRLLRSH